MEKELWAQSFETRSSHITKPCVITNQPARKAYRERKESNHQVNIDRYVKENRTKSFNFFPIYENVWFVLSRSRCWLFRF